MIKIIRIFLALFLSLSLFSSCSYKKKYEDAMLEVKKNNIYENLYEEQKVYAYDLQDSLDNYKQEINSLIFKLEESKDFASQEPVVDTEPAEEDNEKIKRLTEKNASLLKTIAKLDSIVLINNFNQSPTEQVPEQNYSYLSKKVHLINTLRSIQAEFPNQTELLVGNSDIHFSLEREVLFSDTYRFSDVGIEVIRQITQAMNPLFGHEVTVESEYSIEDSSNGQWKDAINGQIMIAQVMKRYGINQDRLDGKNKFLSDDQAAQNYVFKVSELKSSRP